MEGKDISEVNIFWRERGDLFSSYHVLNFVMVNSYQLLTEYTQIKAKKIIIEVIILWQEHERSFIGYIVPFLKPISGTV